MWDIIIIIIIITTTKNNNLSIYISTYIAPLQGNYSEALPGSAKEESLGEFIKRTGKVPWQRMKVRGKTIPNRGTHNRESPFLSGGCKCNNVTNKRAISSDVI